MHPNAKAANRKTTIGVTSASVMLERFNRAKSL